VQEGSGAGPFDQPFDAILVNAGVTHPLAAWLDALAPGGRLMLPLTAAMPAMGPIGKGFLVLIERPVVHESTSSPVHELPWPARLVTMVAIYSAVGIRDDSLNMALGQAMQKQPFARLKSLRRDDHEPGTSCWFHVPGACFSL
jgi:protein-L-isoaspartate(D-aspartate) O-methyltransferase